MVGSVGRNRRIVSRQYLGIASLFVLGGRRSRKKFPASREFGIALFRSAHRQPAYDWWPPVKGTKGMIAPP